MGQSKQMKGKRVLVTGSGTGIGRGIGLAFAQQGADVAFHYAHSSDGAARAAQQARELGRKAEAFKADLGSVEQAKELGANAIDFLGGIDVLVNNAGITMNMPFEQVTPEQFDTLYNVNIRGMFFLTQKCVPTMAEQGGGAVVNISSIHAFVAMQEHSVYTGTKGAIVSYTRELAVELAPENIRINAIAAGAVEVENHYKVIPGYDPAAFGKCIPAGFEGKPSDIANVAIFLASDEARYIVGQTLVVDGGTTSCVSFNEDFRKPLDFSFGKGYVPGL